MEVMIFKRAVQNFGPFLLHIRKNKHIFLKPIHSMLGSKSKYLSYCISTRVCENPYVNFYTSNQG